MNRKKTNSTAGAIEIIEHVESELSKLKKTLTEAELIGIGEKTEGRSVREFEFCGLWKDREDMKGLSTAEWLAKLRREQWGRI